MHVLNVLKFTCGLLIGVVVSVVPGGSVIDANKPAEYHQYNVTVGEEVVLKCDLDFPNGYPISYCVEWKKDDKDLYLKCDDVDPQMFNPNFDNRIAGFEDIGNGSINITDLQIADAGLYECKVIFRLRQPSTTKGVILYDLVIELGTTTTIDETEAPSTDSTMMEVLSNIGPPRDLSVHITSEGYLLRWTPPKYGVDSLRVYVVRLFRGPKKYLEKSIETNQTYHLVTGLDEDEIYNFEVGSLSKNDYDAKSNMVSIHVPAFGAIRIAVAGVGCILLLILIGAIIWYKKFKIHKVPKKDSISNENRNRNSVY